MNPWADLPIVYESASFMTNFILKILYKQNFNERQVFWVLGYFTNVEFTTFRHCTIIKNISQLNVRHAFQASYPSTIVQ